MIDGSESGLSLLNLAVGRLASEPVTQLTDAALGEDLVTLRRSMDLLEAQFARRLSPFDHRRGFAADQCVSTISWLKRHCRLSDGGALERVQVARTTSEMPLLERAFTSGEAGFANVSLVARVASDIGTDKLSSIEDKLTESAKTFEPWQMRMAMRQVRHLVDADGSLDVDNQIYERRYLHLSQTFDGAFALDGLLDAESGSLLTTALSVFEKPLPGDARRASQIRADALIELAKRQLQGGNLPTISGQRPHLTLTTTPEILAEEKPTSVAVLNPVGPIHVETARRISCDAALTTIVMNKASEPLNVSRTSRVVPHHLRLALVARDQGCKFPGCDRKPEWTDAHHIKHWAKGGKTELSNLVLLCRIHHRAVHEGKMTLEPELSSSLVASNSP